MAGAVGMPTRGRVLLFVLCKRAPLLLYFTLAHMWLLPLLYFLYVGGLAQRWVFLATALTAAATFAGSLVRARGGSGLDVLELFHRRRALCAAAPVLYAASYGALAFVIFTSAYLYFTPVLVLELVSAPVVAPTATAVAHQATPPMSPSPPAVLANHTWIEIALGNATVIYDARLWNGDVVPYSSPYRPTPVSEPSVVAVLYMRGIEGGGGVLGKSFILVGGPAGLGWVFYTALWVASLYSAVVASLILAWRWVWRSADLVRRAEEFYEKAREILA